MIRVKILKGGGYRQECYSFYVKNPKKIEFYKKMQEYSQVAHRGDSKIQIFEVKKE